MRHPRTLGLALVLAAAACSPDLPTATGAPAAGRAPSGDPGTVTVAAVPVCVHFGPPPAMGTTWGVPAGTPAGSWIFTESGIPVWIEKFFPTATTTAYNYAKIGVSPVAIGSGQQAYLDRVNLRFDFSNVGFPTSSVTWEWYEPTASSTVNMEANGGGLYIGSITAPAFVSGKPYSSGWAAAGAGRRGRSQITGAITTLRVGGAQLWIDRVCANP